MAVKISPSGRRQFTDSSGNPISGGKLFYYAAGSTTKQNTYTTSVGDTANANPIVLDSSGRTPYGVWFTVGQTYKEVLAPSTDTDPPTSAIYTEDNISGVNDSTTTLDQWVSGATPTYISATSLSLVGDQTTTYHVGRRLKSTNTAGTIYSTITVSAYTTLTTLTVVNDSGTLDSGLSAISYGILSATNIAIPKFTTATASTANVMSLSGNNMTGGINDARGDITQHATTMDFFAVTSPGILDGTGSAVTITACVNAPQKGATRKFYPLANTILTHGATFDIDGNANLVARAGDCWEIEAKTTSTYKAHVWEEGVTKIKARRGTTQSINNASATTVIFATEDYDTLAEYDNATGIATIVKAGYYRISSQVSSESVAWDSGEIWQASIYVNGTVVAEGSLASTPSATVTKTMTSSVDDERLLAASDTVDVRVYHSQGAAVNVVGNANYNRLSISRIL